MQKIILFHQFIFEIQPILESHHQIGHTLFWPCPPQKFSSNFYLNEFVPARKKSVNSISSFSDTVNFRVYRLTTPIFDHSQPRNFESTFNFHEFVSTHKKWGSFINLFLRNNWFKNPAVSLAVNILGYISEKRFFPK